MCIGALADSSRAMLTPEVPDLRDVARSSAKPSHNHPAKRTLLRMPSQGLGLPFPLDGSGANARWRQSRYLRLRITESRVCRKRGIYALKASSFQLASAWQMHANVRKQEAGERP